MCVSGQFTLTYCPSVIFCVPHTSLLSWMASHFPKSFLNFSYTHKRTTKRSRTDTSTALNAVAHTPRTQTHRTARPAEQLLSSSAHTRCLAPARVSFWSPCSRRNTQTGETPLAVFLSLSVQEFEALRGEVPKVPGVNAAV